MRIPLITKYLEEKNMEYQNALLEKQVQEVQNIYLTMRGWRRSVRSTLPCAGWSSPMSRAKFPMTAGAGLRSRQSAD